MQAPRPTHDEMFRQEALLRTQLLDTPIEDRFERLTRLASQLLKTPIAALSLIDRDRQWFKSILGFNVCQTSRDVSFCGHAILSPEVLIVPDARLDPRFADNPMVTGAPNIVFYAGCPVRAPDGSRIGSLCVIDRVPHNPTAEELHALSDLAAIAESEIAQTIPNPIGEHLSQLASRGIKVDPLTRIWSTESIVELLRARIAHARRSGGGVGVLLIDIDNFRAVNETRPREEGDEVLRQLSKIIMRNVRRVDSVGRNSGGEYMVVLGDCKGATAAKLVAERIRTRVALHRFASESGNVELEVSVGVAFDATETPGDEGLFISTAAGALRSAKQNGRNRVELVSLTGPGQTAA
jgi:diguanylate cyclase (GGDEF)-like protein